MNSLNLFQALQLSDVQTSRYGKIIIQLYHEVLCRLRILDTNVCIQHVELKSLPPELFVRVIVGLMIHIRELRNELILIFCEEVDHFMRHACRLLRSDTQIWVLEDEKKIYFPERNVSVQFSNTIDINIRSRVVIVPYSKWFLHVSRRQEVSRQVILLCGAYKKSKPFWKIW